MALAFEKLLVSKRPVEGNRTDVVRCGRGLSELDRRGMHVAWLAMAAAAACLMAQVAWAQSPSDSAVVPDATRAPARIASKVPDPLETTRPAEPAKVAVGIYAVRMTSLDITQNQFSLDFYVWFRWADDQLKPYETFELVNGRIDSRQLDCLRRIGQVNYACVRVQATLSRAWDVRRFPLGSQTPTVELEDGDLEADQLQYVADSENCGIDEGFHVSGWKVEDCRSQTLTHTYTTNYGDIRHPRDKGARFSRFVFSIHMGRMGVFHAFKVFTGLYLAALVAFTVFFVRPDHRLALTVGAVFAVVASHAVISAYLPEVGVLTLADKLHLVTAGVILLSLFETAYSLHLYNQKREAASRTIDRVAFWVIAPIFLAANIWFLVT